MCREARVITLAKGERYAIPFGVVFLLIEAGISRRATVA
jgi:hypothetical protein